MDSVRSNLYPQAVRGPLERVAARYSCVPECGRIVNKSGDPAYDYTTSQGEVITGNSGGVLAHDQIGTGWWIKPTVITTGVGFGCIYRTDRNPTGDRFPLVLGNALQHHIRIGAGLMRASLSGGAVYTNLAFDPLGRGPFHFVLRHNATTGMQEIYCNGTYNNADATVPVAPAAGTDTIGCHGEFSGAWVYTTTPTPDEIRADYISNFAKKVLWQWQPQDGITPAGGILTGSYSGVGGWTCPLGAATMGFVWRPDLSAPGGGRLALTDTQVAAMNRIDLEFGNRPLFGTWVIEYTIRDPATDSPVIGFTPRRGVDPQAAASQSYWCWMRTAAGPWWRVSMGYENNTAVPIDSADAPNPGPNAGDRCIAVVSRDVDGTVQTWNYVPNPQRGWWWTTATGNDVTTVNEGCITVAPRGSYIERVTWFQGAASPHELGIQVP